MFDIEWNVIRVGEKLSAVHRRAVSDCRLPAKQQCCRYAVEMRPHAFPLYHLGKRMISEIRYSNNQFISALYIISTLHSISTF